MNDEQDTSRTTLKLAEVTGLGRLAVCIQWCVLVAMSVAASAIINISGLPGAWLLGPMIVAVILKINGGTVNVPGWIYAVAMAVVGCLVASSVGSQSISRFLTQWPWFVGVVLVTVVSTGALGILFSHYKLLPGASAIWGLSPGAASVMVIMSEAYGEDFRLVAFMQYLRVALVAVVAAVVAQAVFGASDHPTHAINWFPPVHREWLWESLAIAGIGGVVGKLLRIPAGIMIVPMFAGMLFQATGYVTIELPPWLVIPCYAVLGWYVGLSFTKALCVHALRVLPAILGSIAIMMAFCGVLAWVVVIYLNVDPLTAFLATAPGGVDAVIVIAASSKADLAFVMTFQIVRMVLVVAVAPPLARWLARRFKSASSVPT
jgi:membrane AbrB-like protein